MHPHRFSNSYRRLNISLLKSLYMAVQGFCSRFQPLRISFQSSCTLFQSYRMVVQLFCTLVKFIRTSVWSIRRTVSNCRSINYCPALCLQTIGADVQALRTHLHKLQKTIQNICMLVHKTCTSCYINR